jgi:uncharacterized protein (DUF1501 family)
MNVSRRDFITSGVGVVLSSSQLFALAARAASFEPRRIGSSKILVVVQLAGGNDGLNTVVPYGMGQYYELRPNIAIQASDVLPLSNTIGLHNNMGALNNVYKSGKLAIALGVGYPNPNRSHFRSIEIWQTAEPVRMASTGWLGRYLDATANSSTATASGKLFPAINVDPILPKTLAGDRVIVPSVSDVNQFRFSTDAHYRMDRQQQIDAFNRIYSSFDLNRPSAQLLREIGLDSMQASDYLVNVVRNYKSSVKYPDNGFGRGMKFIAQMITAGVDARIYNISLGGFDTHANQLSVQPNLLKQFSESLAAFQKDLEEHGVDKDVMLFSFSEFGRRVSENGGRGTDHGTAEPVFIMGSAVKGGIYGEYPSLTNLDQGDLKYNVDFRTIYATLLDRWLGVDSRQVLGAKYETLRFV